jgi:hypothetical protein
MGLNRQGEPYWRQFLAAIAEADSPLSTGQLMDACDVAPGQPRQRRLARVNWLIAQALNNQGPILERAGVVGASWQRPAMNLWAATALGGQKLAVPWDPETKGARMKREAQERREARARRFRDLLTLPAQRDWSPHSPIGVRRAAVQELTAGGYTLSEIAWIFGVSRETIRTDRDGKKAARTG